MKMSENILTKDDCKKVLSRRFGREDANLISYKIKPLSDVAQGFGGEHYKLEIACVLSGQELVEVFFLKAKPRKREFQEIMAKDINIYQHEIFIYNVLFQEFEKYGFDTSFAAKCYHFIPNKCLILEDMSLRGFKLPERFKMFSLDQVKFGLKALAQFHGAGYLYEETKTEELGRTFRLNTEYCDYLNRELFFGLSSEKASDGLKWVKAAFKTYLGLIDYLPESQVFKEDFKKRLEGKEIGKIFYEDNTKIRKTLGHGDLWSNNIFFKLENDVKECCLLDFQTARYFYPTYDVMLFLWANASREFRKRYLAKLLDYYYNCLTDELAKHDYSIDDIYPQQDYEASIDIVKFDAQMHAASLHSYWCDSPEFFTEKINAGGNEWEEFLFGDRKTHLLKWINSDEHFRNLIVETMYDLYDALF